ncbi:MAG: protoporphyrinogen oxidase HemJ [Hyphomicrobiales bacterium]|nr:protoporphyrinogen oxidase HemJ [Hyphomicrobiales bacterium]
MIEWLKVCHIVSVISWMVGMFYLPRLMVYHSDKEPGSDASETFKVMERRLLKVIMTPAMMASWFFGLLLAWQNDFWLEGWFVSKLFLALLLGAQHGFCVIWVREFAADERKHKARFYRLANEIPTVLMIMIIILVEIQPF